MTPHRGAAAGHCAVPGCRYAQAPDSPIPLCFRHRDAFQRSEAYRRGLEGPERPQVNRLAVSLADWLEELEAAKTDNHPHGSKPRG